MRYLSRMKHSSEEAVRVGSWSLALDREVGLCLLGGKHHCLEYTDQSVYVNRVGMNFAKKQGIVPVAPGNGISSMIHDAMMTSLIDSDMLSRYHQY